MRDTRFSIPTAAIAGVMIVLLIVPSDLNYSATGFGTDANPVTRVLWLSILAVGGALVLLRMSMTLRLLREINVFFLVFVGLAAASIFWSIDPGLTLLRTARLAIMCTAFLAVAVAGWHARRFQQLTRPVIAWMLLGSIVFVAARPDLAIHQELSPELAHAWKGLTLTKNGLGALSSFGFLLWLHAWLSRETGRAAALIGGSIAAVCLVMSRSSTSVMATAFASMAMLLLMRAPGSMRRAMPFYSTALLVVILTYAMAALRVVPGLEILLAPIPMITGKDLTFSNRAEIWALILEHARMRPIIGSGYEAYWAAGAPNPGMESYSLIARLQGFYPTNSHNGYLDVLNDLGAIGLLCLGGYLAMFLRQSLRLYALDRAQGALYLCLLLQQAIVNLSEARWFNTTSFIDFAVLSIATTCLARALLELRSRRRNGPADSAMRSRVAVRAAGIRRPGSRLLVRPRNDSHPGAPEG